MIEFDTSPEAMIKLWTTKEDLCEELLRYYTISAKNIPMVRHPLVYSIFYSPVENAMLNKRLQVMKEVVKEYLEQGKYSSYVFMHEKPHRLHALMEIERHLKDGEYWELCREVWTDSENVWQNKDLWRLVLQSPRKRKELFMTPSDRKVFKSLPAKITAYRGYNPAKGKSGLSFTLSMEKAEWFAKRYWSKEGKVWIREIPKNKIFAYTNDRDEQEIIIL